MINKLASTLVGNTPSSPNSFSRRKICFWYLSYHGASSLSRHDKAYNEFN